MLNSSLPFFAAHEAGPKPHVGKSDPLAAKAVFSRTQEGGGASFIFTGSLTVHSLHGIEEAVRDAVTQASGPVRINIEGLTGFDTAGSLLLNKTAIALRAKGLECALSSSDPLRAKLLEKSLPAPDKPATAQRHSALVALCNSIGRKFCEELDMTGQLIGFLGKFLITLGRLALHPRRMRWTSLVFHMEQTGLRAVPIVALLTFLIGMVVAYMGAEQLERFGAQIFAVNLLEVTVMREMAVLITSIVVAGRSSSSFTAQIGAMVANEEVDAMLSMGLDPGTLLVVPRVLALILCLPMLVFIADIMALLGGAAAIWYSIGMGFSDFVSQFHEVASLNNFFVGLVKTPFFALSIGLVGCFQGFRATSSAESVGLLTTVSVVESIFVVILLDALFAIFFTTIGI